MSAAAHRRTATAALLAVVVVGAPSALAHAPRDHRPGAPLMDLEVLVTPPVTGRTTPGGTDPVVSVDGFGNRFAMARKETVERGVGVDQRARAMVRAAPWLWTSADEGDTWDNLDLLPRGADALLPEGDFDVASAGATTYVVTTTPAGAVLTRLTATKRGRVTAATPEPVPAPHLPGDDLALAAHASGAVLLVGGPTGTAVFALRDRAVKQVATLPQTSCDVAAGATRAVVACRDGAAVTRTVVDLVSGRTTTTPLGPADTRGGAPGTPSVDLAADGSSVVLSGTRLWRTTAAGRTSTQELRTEGGDHRATNVAVSHKGRVGVAAYRKGAQGTWNVVVTVFTPGRRPVWSDFAFHDPASPPSASEPPSGRLAVDFDDKGRVQVLWTATFLHQADLDVPLLRNIWAVRSTTS